MELELEDIETLMEALDALEQKAMSDGIVGGLLGMMLSDSKEQARGVLEKEISEAQQEGEATKERVILTKAKLVQMKRKMIANEAADFLRKGQ